MKQHRISEHTFNFISRVRARFLYVNVSLFEYFIGQLVVQWYHSKCMVCPISRCTTEQEQGTFIFGIKHFDILCFKFFFVWLHILSVSLIFFLKYLFQWLENKHFRRKASLMQFMLNFWRWIQVLRCYFSIENSLILQHHMKSINFCCISIRWCQFYLIRIEIFRFMFGITQFHSMWSSFYFYAFVNWFFSLHEVASCRLI